jgi:hypothetical protein
MFKKPYLTTGSGMLYGFASSFLTRPERVRDVNFIRYIRQQQLNRLLGRPTIWQ